MGDGETPPPPGGGTSNPPDDSAAKAARVVSAASAAARARIHKGPCQCAFCAPLNNVADSLTAAGVNWAAQE